MVNFKEKIEFLLENLYKNDINEFVKNFIKYSSPTSKELRKRKVAIKKWFNDKNIKSPYIAKDYENYGIAKLRFQNGMQVFPLVSFEWDLEKFKERFKRYQYEIKNSNISLKDYKYIYYFHEESKKLVYLEIIYLDDNKIQLISKHHTHIIDYQGHIYFHKASGLFHFLASYDEEKMFFSFNSTDLKLDYRIYGLNLSKDYLSKNPKSSLVLLSQKPLTDSEEELFKTRLNPSNILISDNDKMGIERSFIENFSQHIRDLKFCVDDFTSQDIFLNVFLSEFNIFYKKFDQFYNRYEYTFSSFSKSVIKIIDSIQTRGEKYHFKILYTIKDISESIFSSDSNSVNLYNLFIKLSKNNKLSFEFIFVIGKNLIINSKLKKKFKEFENAGISILFRKEENIQSYSNIFLIESFDLFAIFNLKLDNEYRVTRYSTEINKLKKEFSFQKRSAKSLKKFLKDEYPLNGIWHLYGYGSKNSFHFATINIDENSINITLDSHNNKKYYGVMYRMYGDVIFITDLGIFKFQDKNREIIKIISFISDQHNGNGKPIILFAILSRVKIDKEDIDNFFLNLVDRKSSPYSKASFKLSLSIDEVLSDLLFKYEKLYKL